MKSKYFGYTLRGAGTPYQQWVLSDLPITVEGVYTSTSTNAVPVASKIPIQTISFNQLGARVGADGTICLPQGVYKVEYSGILSTAAAGAIKIDLVSGGSVISEVQEVTSANGDGAFTSTISGTGIIKACGTTSISIVNNSTVAVTPVVAGTETFRVFITRLA